MNSIKEALNSYKEEIVNAKGITLNIDDIECYGLWGKIKKISFLGRVIYKGLGKAIFVDKSHDLPFYIEGDDYINRSLNSTVTFGYEWGGYGEKTRIQNTYIGAGLSNTNSLICKDLNTFSRGWDTIWKKIEIFRRTHSDNWFLPSADELNLIYEVIDNIDNLSLLMNSYYWSSSEASADSDSDVWIQRFDNGRQNTYGKYYRCIRSRLCVQY